MGVVCVGVCLRCGPCGGLLRVSYIVPLPFGLFFSARGGAVLSRVAHRPSDASLLVQLETVHARKRAAYGSHAFGVWWVRSGTAVRYGSAWYTINYK